MYHLNTSLLETGQPFGVCPKAKVFLLLSHGSIRPQTVYPSIQPAKQCQLPFRGIGRLEDHRAAADTKRLTKQFVRMFGVMQDKNQQRSIKGSGSVGQSPSFVHV